MKRCLIAFVLFTCPLSAIEWDQVMSQDDQRATGVWRLSQRERQALAQWVSLYSQGKTRAPRTRSTAKAEAPEKEKDQDSTL